MRAERLCESGVVSSGSRDANRFLRESPRTRLVRGPLQLDRELAQRAGAKRCHIVRKHPESLFQGLDASLLNSAERCDPPTL